MVEEETEFFYDNNGNLVQDKNRSIDNIDYNILNLPNNISFKEKGLNIGFSYDAVGRKLKARYGTSAHNLFVPVGNTMPVSENDMQYTDSTDYCGNYLYENGALSKIYIPDGYIKVGKGNGSEPEYTFYQYIHDHQGNIRAVLNGNRLCYNYDYYPEGAMHGDIDGLEPQTDDRKRYNGKEHETMHGLGWYDYSARWYDPRLTVRFTTPDPKTEEFYDLSPYIYCGGDPVNYIDPDGMKLLYANGVSENFKTKFSLTIQFMNRMGSSGIIKAINDRPEIIYISEKKGQSSFNPKTNTIEWDPNLGVLTNNNIIISPATVLNHEADHALQEYIHPIQKREDLKSSDIRYKNKEEKRVITGSEQETALKHGEIKKGEITRTDHEGIRYYTKSPISTKSKFEINVIAKPK